jgi:hypothetical protein
MNLRYVGPTGLVGSVSDISRNMPGLTALGEYFVLGIFYKYAGPNGPRRILRPLDISTNMPGLTALGGILAR